MKLHSGVIVISGCADKTNCSNVVPLLAGPETKIYLDELINACIGETSVLLLTYARFKVSNGGKD